tara:strand:+ start:2553 stop:3005 length:453 start_codon:yes stop_codon:yes gene_type:complete
MIATQQITVYSLQDLATWSLRDGFRVVQVDQARFACVKDTVAATATAAVTAPDALAWAQESGFYSPAIGVCEHLLLCLQGELEERCFGSAGTFTKAHGFLAALETVLLRAPEVRTEVEPVKVHIEVEENFNPDSQGFDSAEGGHAGGSRD